MTKALIMAKQFKIPYKEYEHNPEIANMYENTVAI